MKKINESLFQNKEECIKEINRVSHRSYVGGLWNEMGELQFNFLVDNGLTPDHILVDIACGSLRGGVYFVPYLNEGNYLGIDKEQLLIDSGINELGDYYKLKKPELVCSKYFEFSKFTKKPDYGIAQSIFTHIPLELVTLCLENLYEYLDGKQMILFATVLEGDMRYNKAVSSDWERFHYNESDLKLIGSKTGWDVQWIGEWKHPRNQKMVKFTNKK